MRTIAAGAGAMLALVACGGDLNHSAVRDTAGGEVVERVELDSMPRGGGVLLASLSEWKVDMPLDTVPPGRYTFLVRNAGRVTHALEVEASGEGPDDYEVESGRMAPTGTEELSLDLKPGRYDIYCPIEDSSGSHKKRGMRRTLLVRPTQ